MRTAGALAAFALLCSPAFSMRNEVVEGNAGAPLRVVIYEDLQCGDCLRLRSLLDDKVLAKYGKRVAFVHRDFPLGKHEWARDAAIAGRWVYEHSPQLGIVFRREIMSQQDHITARTLRPWLLEFAARNKLDQKGILDSLDDVRLKTQVEQDYQSGIARGVTRVPAVYLGPQSIVETIVYEDLAKLIDSELAR